VPNNLGRVCWIAWHFQRVLLFLIAGNLKVILWEALWHFQLYLSIFAPFVLQFLYRYTAEIFCWSGHTCSLWLCVPLQRAALVLALLGVNESLTPNLLPWGFSVQCVESSCRSMDLCRVLLVHVHWWRLNWDLAYRIIQWWFRAMFLVAWTYFEGMLHFLTICFTSIVSWACTGALDDCFVTCRGHHWVVIFTVFHMWNVQMHDRFPRTSIVIDSTFLSSVGFISIFYLRVVL